MKLTVRVHTSRWAWSDPDEPVVLDAGDHVLPDDGVPVTAGLVRAVGASVASGAVEVLDADAKARKILDGAVEPDTVSAGKLDAAMADGSWQAGNLEQYELDLAAKAAASGEGDA